MQPEIAIAIISAVVAISASIVTGFVKVRIDGEIDALHRQIDQQETAFQLAKERIRKLECDNRKLRKIIERLECENKALHRRLSSRNSGPRRRRVNDDPAQPA